MAYHPSPTKSRLPSNSHFPGLLIQTSVPSTPLALTIQTSPTSDWLHKTYVIFYELDDNVLSYKRNIRLSGLVYFHRISDSRMAGTPLKNLRLFEKLCGEEFDSIILTTIMWNEADDNLGNGCEDELKTLNWKSMTLNVFSTLANPLSRFLPL